jgi:hypothetical protein
MSAPLSAGSIKPNPLDLLKNFTVPSFIYLKFKNNLLCVNSAVQQVAFRSNGSAKLKSVGKFFLEGNLYTQILFC